MPNVIRVLDTAAAGFSRGSDPQACYARISKRLPRRGKRSGPPPACAPFADAASAGPLPAGTRWVRVAAAARPGGSETVTGAAAGRPPAALPPAVENAAREVLGIIAADHRPHVPNAGLTRLDQLGQATPRNACSAWMPGSVLPSSHSRNAPPAVDT